MAGKKTLRGGAKRPSRPGRDERDMGSRPSGSSRGSVQVDMPCDQPARPASRESGRGGRAVLDVLCYRASISMRRDQPPRQGLVGEMGD